MPETNVIAVSFGEESKAYQGLSVLRDVAASGRVGLRSAAIVERDEAGGLSIPESVNPEAGERTLGGSLIGLFVGILGGPVGMLIGWGTGTLIGGALDVQRSAQSEDVMAEFGQAIPPGTAALVAEVDEDDIRVIDSEMGELGGTVIRRSADEVLAELEAAHAAAEAAEREARQTVREHKKTERHEEYEERKEALRKKLGLE